MRSWWRFRDGETMPDGPIIHYIITKIDKVKNDAFVTIMCRNDTPWKKLSPGVGSPDITAVTCAACHLEAMKLQAREGKNNAI
jgi:hypothetical protein